ncbi:MAG: hypothetical protein ACD_5C00141G0002 [uncultured bacterium]|nr:MAG: hypothetical protein ACD_5C00141G0002 [uncultured bacterium]
MLIRLLVALFTITNREARNARRVIGEEIERMRFALISVAGATLLGVAFILIMKPSIGTSVCWTLPLWLFSAYRIFSIRRLIGLEITGKLVEFMGRLLRGRLRLAISGLGYLGNELIVTYWRTISTTFLLQTALFLALPLYVNYTYGGVVVIIMIVMVSVIVAIRNYGMFERYLRYGINMLVVGYVIGIIFAMFPHAGFYIGGLTKRVSVVNASTAKKVNELNEIRSEQQEVIDNQFVDGIIAWQKKHPGQELPPEYQARLDRARQLKLL